MLPELVSFCLQSVTIEARSSVDSYGNPSYGAATTYAVRVSGKRRRIMLDNGDEVMSTHAVYFA